MCTFQRAAVTILVAGLAGSGVRADDTRASKELGTLWTDLGTADPVLADRTIAALVAKPAQTVPFLKERLQPVPRPDPRRLARLMANLDNDRFSVRENATEELERLGEVAEVALRQALAGKPAPEARRRIDRVLETNKRHRLHPPPDQLRLARAVEVLEQIGDPAARQLLATLARGAPAAPVTRDAEGALHRLVQRLDP